MSNATMIKLSSLEEVGNALVESAGAATKAGTDMVMKIVNNTVVPWSLIGLLMLMLYFIAAIAWEKKKNNGEATSAKVLGLGITFVVFLVIGAYSVIFGGLINVITGAA